MNLLSELNPEHDMTRNMTLQSGLRDLQFGATGVESLRFMAKDEYVENMFKKLFSFVDAEGTHPYYALDPDYEMLAKLTTLIASPMNRTSILTEKEARLARIRLNKITIKLKAITRNKHKGYGPLLDAWLFFVNGVVNDQLEGHRSKLWQEKKVVAMVQPTKQKKKSWWRR